jgi:hypothetical protein
MKESTLKQVARIVEKSGYTSEVNQENASGLINSLAKNQPEFLAAELEKMYNFAVSQYDSRGDKGDLNYQVISDNADAIMGLLNIQTDYPGLYPTFEIDRGGIHLCEYSTLGAIRQYNNFWNHWQEDK